MGTSSSYDAPPSWGGFKGEVTRIAGEGSVTSSEAGELLRRLIHYNGGARATSGRGRGHGGGSVANGRAARSIAARLGGFIAEVSRVGLDGALHNAGWSDLVGLPVSDILAGLLDRLGGEASTIDAVDARMALSQLQDKYFANAATSAELEQLLQGQVHNLDSILQDFFGFYLFEVFCRVFFERLVQRVGEQRAQSFLGEISDFIVATLANQTSDRDISGIDWTGREGEAKTAEIMEIVLDVFGG